MTQVYGNKWEVLEGIGEGGQGHIFKVKHTSTGQLAVLKRIKNLGRLPRLAHEVQALRTLNHPGIVRILDADLDDSRPWLVMEFCRAGSLANHADKWASDPPAALRALHDIAEAVGAAHAKGIVHRDLKPENILLRTSDGPLVVCDFGLCYIDEVGRHTTTEEAIGSRKYIAPELEDGRATEVSPRCDVYALGKLLYWIISGGQVFSREQHRDARWNLATLRGDPQMEHVNILLDQMVVRDPSLRLPDGAAVARAVTGVVTRMDRGYNIVAENLPQLCTYCGMGDYSIRKLDSSTALHNFGLAAGVGGLWYILVCGKCGHVQMFRPDLADRDNPWASRDETDSSAPPLEVIAPEDPRAGVAEALNEEAKELLREAARDPQGTIWKTSNLGGNFVRTNGKTFGNPSEARSMARWEYAVDVLVERRLIAARGASREAFQVTEPGYQLAEFLDA